MTIGRPAARGRAPTDADPTICGPSRSSSASRNGRRARAGIRVGRHGSPVRGDDRGPHPAPSPRQGNRLGHGRVLDAAAGHRRAHAAGEPRKGRIGGRTHEIQRLIGRSLRGVVDLAKLGERTVTVDCDVLQADGGTRIASITGGYVALAAALHHLRHGTAARRARWRRSAWASSAGCTLLDLDYSEDSHAEVDFNVVGTDAGTYVEVQGTAEGRPFDRAASWTACSTWSTGLGTPVRCPGGRAPGATGTDGEPAPAPARRHALACTSSPSSRVAASRARGPRLARRPGVPANRETGETFEPTPRSRRASGLGRPGCRRSRTTPASRWTRSDGGPGVRTRRYAGEDATDEANNAKLLEALAGLAAGAARRSLRCAWPWRVPDGPGPRGGCRPVHPWNLPGRIARRPTGRRAVSATTRSSSRRPSRPVVRRWGSGRPSASGP